MQATGSLKPIRIDTGKRVEHPKFGIGTVFTYNSATKKHGVDFDIGFTRHGFLVHELKLLENTEDEDKQADLSAFF